jgi:hypothetical protein
VLAADVAPGGGSGVTRVTPGIRLAGSDSTTPEAASRWRARARRAAFVPPAITAAANPRAALVAARAERDKVLAART